MLNQPWQIQLIRPDMQTLSGLVPPRKPLPHNGSELHRADLRHLTEQDYSQNQVPLFSRAYRRGRVQ